MPQLVLLQPLACHVTFGVIAQSATAARGVFSDPSAAWPPPSLLLRACPEDGPGQAVVDAHRPAAHRPEQEREPRAGVRRDPAPVPASRLEQGGGGGTRAGPQAAHAPGQQGVACGEYGGEQDPVGHPAHAAHDIPSDSTREPWRPHAAPALVGSAALALPAGGSEQRGACGEHERDDVAAR